MIPLIYHSIYSELPLPQGHRYPIHKYRLLFNEIEKVRFRDEQWRTFFTIVSPKR